MNQQRSRRFRAARERDELRAEAVRRGEIVDEDAEFDSNCITPGTGFMARLGRHLRFFIRKKISEDVAWQAPAVVFSGHEVPGAPPPGGGGVFCLRGCGEEAGGGARGAHPPLSAPLAPAADRRPPIRPSRQKPLSIKPPAPHAQSTQTHPNPSKPHINPK